MDAKTEPFSVAFKNIVDHINDADILVQLGVSIFFSLLSFLIAIPIKKSLKRDCFLERPYFSKIKIAYTLAYPLVWFVIQWITVLVFKLLGRDIILIYPIAGLLTSWIIINLMGSFVQQTMMFRLVSVSAWMVAVLEIAGFLGPIRDSLGQVDMHLGQLKLTALALVQGFLAIIFLLWLAVSLSKYVETRISKDSRIEPSAKVLFTKIVKIMLYVIAFFWGISIMGINVSALAFMGGAIGVGIGFGLQKVVSNFICGIILLVDKSIKPGDVIAIEGGGGAYGYVNRLNARYVSVRTRSGKEHLIPNEDFVTKKVENWSFSDKLVRLKINVGVAYDSDIHLVQKVLNQAIGEIDRILEVPQPGVRLSEFGESSVKFELRVWISDPEKGLMNVQSDLLIRVWDLFKENDITLPFPQRDLHIKSSSLNFSAFKAETNH